MSATTTMPPVHRAPCHDVLVIGTYPPRRCGLATFTANTRGGLLSAAADRRVDVLRLGDVEPGDAADPPEVIATWGTTDDVDDVAAICNRYASVLLQHEFGIFPGSDGDRVLDLVARLHVPVVTVLHTVLIDPSARQRRVVEELAQHSAAVVVLTPSAADRLVRRYAVDRSIVSVIPHGAEPNLGPCTREPGAIPTLLTWGLLGPGKGIEHAIKAVVILAGRGIIVRYVVAGQTHPNVAAYEGERYREALVQLAEELGAGSLVTFDDRYRDWAGLFALIRTADIVVLPYDSREQVTSGVLVDALASGKPVVATAFPHALDLVDGHCGVVVPHEEPEAMADAIQRLLTDRQFAASCVAAAELETARHAWPVVGRQYDELLRSVENHHAAVGA